MWNAQYVLRNNLQLCSMLRVIWLEVISKHVYGNLGAIDNNEQLSIIHEKTLAIEFLLEFLPSHEFRGLLRLDCRHYENCPPNFFKFPSATLDIIVYCPTRDG